jgi:hypothetical protein
MKKILAFVIAAMMLAAMVPAALAASIPSITVAVPEIKGLQMTLTKVQDKYSHEAFMFDPNQTPYFFYFEKGGTVTFSKKVTLSFVDLTTYATSTVDYEANKAITVDDSFTGASLYFDDAAKGFVGFISIDDPVRGAGASACTLDINELSVAAAPAAPANEPAPSAPAAAPEAPAAAPEAPAAAAPEAPVTTQEDPAAAAPEAPAAEPASEAAPAAPAAPVAPAGGGNTVYITVAVDGKVVVAAEPLTTSGTTVDAVLKDAHIAFYADGEAGYVAGIDSMWNMFLITKCWGVTATPFVIVNGGPLGSTANPDTADIAPVRNGDNIIISTSSDPNVPALAIALSVDVADGSATVTATNWVLDFTTFTYQSSPFADAEVTDPATGASLGKTDAEGKITVTPPESGVVVVGNVSAIRVDGSAITAEELAAAAAEAAAATPKLPLFYDVTWNLIIVTVVFMAPVFTAIIVNLSHRRKLDKKAKTVK